MNYDVEGIKVYIYWGVDGESPYAEIQYGARREITPGSGDGALAMLATFTQE
jgi:hypothetical protein